MKPAERLKRSRGGYKGANTQLKKRLESAGKPRYPRVSPQEREKMLRYWVTSSQVPWSQDLFDLLKNDPAQHGISV